MGAPEPIWRGMSRNPTTLTTTATCLVPDCGWTETGAGADRAAERHTKTEGHPTGVRSTP